MSARKKSREITAARLLRLNPKRLLVTGAIVWGAVALFFGIHAIAPQSVSDKMEACALNVIDLVRESHAAPAEVVFWLDIVADHVPLTRGKIVAADAAALGDSGHALGGAPEAEFALTGLANKGYIVGYDEARKNPAWVAYRVFPPRHPASPRPKDFLPDTRTRARVESRDYSRSGYDRGHMAPNRAISLCYGEAAQRETFLMSNVVPQLHDLNGAFWEAMEARVIHRYTRRYGDVWVICGPVYDAANAPQRFKNGTAIPHAFFLIIAEQSQGGIRAEAFLVPHRAVKKTADPSQFLTSIREIEKKTGLNFFAKLPPQTQDLLELEPAKRAW